MKEVPKAYLTIFALIFMFIVLYSIQNPKCTIQFRYSDLNNQLQNPNGSKQKVEDAMVCLAHGFYFIQKFYTSFTEMWNHYSAVIEVSVNHLSIITK